MENSNQPQKHTKPEKDCLEMHTYILKIYLKAKRKVNKMVQKTIFPQERRDYEGIKELQTWR